MDDMFKKFEMKNSILQYGLSSMDAQLAWAILQTEDIDNCFNQLSPENQEKFDMFFGCKNVEAWKLERCPYYRIYHGVFESLLKMDLDKLLDLERTPLPFGLKTIEIEIPRDYWNLFDCTAIIIGDLGEYYSLTQQRIEGKYLYNALSIPNIKEDLSKVNNVTRNFSKIIFGVLTIGENPDIVKPVVLKADEKKYQLTGDEKYVEKARRRGVIGFDVGEDIPTIAQFKKMVEENELAIKQGRKAPHYRRPCLAWVHTKEGPRITKREGCFVNWDLLDKLPQGFYEE